MPAPAGGGDIPRGTPPRGSAAAGGHARATRGFLIAIAAAGVLTGCGSAAIKRESSPVTVAQQISPRLRREEQRIHAQVTVSLHHLADRNVRYGGIPSFIPNGGHPVNQVLDASPRHPALSIEGDAIHIRLPGGSSTATMVGPYIPRRLQGTAVRTTPATLTLTFTRARGALPLTSQAFSIVDEQGQILRPVPTTVSGRPLPSRVPAGRPLVLRFRLILPIGNGTLRYTPAGSGRFLAAWDFDVETD